MTVQKTIGAVLLCCGLLLGAAILWRSIREREAFRAEKGNFALLGIMEIAVYFCATLGISDFLLNTIPYRQMRLAEDKKLPGTLIAAGLVPGSVIAFSLLQVDNPVELPTLILCSASIAAGCVLGARLVGRIDGSKIRRVLGIALIGSLIALSVKIIVSSGATGTAVGLTPAQLAIAVPFSIFWGAVNMLGVPGKPAGTAFFLIMGMSPLSTITLVLVMGCIGPMSGSIHVVRGGNYHRKLCSAAVIFGSVGAILGTLFAISINATLLNILLLAVMLIAIFSMFR